MMSRGPLRRGRWLVQAAWLALGSSILVPIGEAQAAMPDRSRVEFVTEDYGCFGSGNVERTVLTQRGDSAFVAVSAWTRHDTGLLTSRLPMQVYAAFWDS